MPYVYTLTSATLAANAQPVTRSDGAFVPADSGNRDFQDYLAWLAVPNTPTPAPVAPAPVPSCLLWQLEAVCNEPPAALGFTPPTWANIATVIAGLSNAAVTAFFNQGLNPIPANSTTLAMIASRTTPTLTGAQLTALVAAAAGVVIS